MKKTNLHAQMRQELKDKSLLEQAKQYAFDYIDGIENRPVYPDTAAVNNLNRFDEPLPEHPQSGDEVLTQLKDYGGPATVAQTGGRYFGFVNGGVAPYEDSIHGNPFARLDQQNITHSEFHIMNLLFRVMQTASFNGDDMEVEIAHKVGFH